MCRIFFFGLLPPLFALRYAAPIFPPLNTPQLSLANHEDMGTVMPHLEALLALLTGPLLHDANFTISLTTLEILADLVDKVGFQIRAHVRTLLVSLASRLGDNKVVIRTTLMAIIMRLMRVVTPGPVLGVLLRNLHADAWRVRAEVVDVITATLLQFPDYDFDIDKLVSPLCTLLADANARVQFVAVEALALIHALVGDELFTVMSTRVDKATLRTLRRRVADEGAFLPRIGKNGLVEHMARDSADNDGGDDGGALGGIGDGTRDRTGGRRAVTGSRRMEYNPRASTARGAGSTGGGNNRRIKSARLRRGNVPGAIVGGGATGRGRSRGSGVASPVYDDLDWAQQVRACACVSVVMGCL